MKTAQLNIRITPDEAETLDKICSDLFTRQKLATLLLKAAIKAIADNKCQLGLPPKFRVAGFDEAFVTTEIAQTITPKRK